MLHRHAFATIGRSFRGIMRDVNPVLSDISSAVKSYFWEETSARCEKFCDPRLSTAVSIGAICGSTSHAVDSLRISDLDLVKKEWAQTLLQVGEESIRELVVPVGVRRVASIDELISIHELLCGRERDCRYSN